MKHIALMALGLLASACAAGPIQTAAQEPSPDAPRTIEVSARAVVSRAPDRAAVRFGVETVAPAARSAIQQNADAMASVLAALEALGVDRDAIRTDALSLQPRFERRPTGEPEITGYQASNQIRVTLTNTEDIGSVIDSGVEAGANRVLGIRFEIADPETAYHEALEKAIGMAQRQAEVAAAALGETLGPALRVNTSGPPTPWVRGAGPEVMRASSTTPVEPGRPEVGASVSITYRIGP